MKQMYSSQNPAKLLTALLIILTVVHPACGKSQGGGDFFFFLKQRLKDEGLDAVRVDKVYSDRRVAADFRAVASFFVHNESRIDYRRYLNDQWVRKGRDYMQKHGKSLTSVKLQYGVAPQIITAIMLVETHLGSYMGKSSVLNTLSTMAAMSDENAMRSMWQKIKPMAKMSWSQFQKKARRKSAWAYGELKAFLVYAFGQDLDPVQVKGSYAGAIGLPQFMPSNILPFGRDGNGDGRVDLFDHHDAIASIAAYLRHHGWKPGIDRRRAFKVIYHYNHSSYYVNTVLDLADLLKG